MKVNLKDIILLLLFIAIIIWLITCNGFGGRGTVVKETIVHDTVWKEIKGDTSYVPIVRNHYLPGENKVFEKWDTAYIVDSSYYTQWGTDTSNLFKLLFYSYTTYADTLNNPYGNIIVEDTISRNKILGRGVKTNLKVPEVTTTITRTILDKRVQLYAGLSLFGNSKELASGAGFNFTLKTKNDRMIELGYNKIFNGMGYYELGYKHKISFRKK